ncbi:pilus assembly protein N-terminal domain-containing protein [Hyphococcus flavus]|uniref:Pilus assembly protein N-terminal domain-containing protein n=1 Tax=Hyphococcus flavus TaxID=1866326 RepID=A0AAF0CCC9_9PROT|nr:pilus assembly protein N-terminal domain-containing protein [Hyphococcus flavus]WDI33190.1 pilus assembly protein N-terminal domain-containing protein [Hyphococcus flavus]
MRRIFAAAIAFVSLSQTAAAEQLWLTMDQVRPYKLDNPAQSIVVGNPAIADVTVQDNTNVLLFGKAPGLTNIYVFNEQGEAVKNLIIRVRTPSADMLTVHRGVARTTYNCTTNCEATVTVGDDNTTFQGVAAQVQNKFSQATSLAQADKEN